MTEKENLKISDSNSQLAESDNELVRRIAEQKYEYGFTTDIHTESIPTGLNEDVVRLISQKKGEPEWLLDFRLKAFRYWSTSCATGFAVWLTNFACVRSAPLSSTPG